MRFSTLFAALFCLGAGLSAATETFTPTLTATATPSWTVSPTFTATPTVTPGPGNWSFSSANPLVGGSSGNSAIWSYTAAGPWANGYLTFVFPGGIDPPSASNFYIQPSQGVNLNPSPYTFNGVTVQVSVSFIVPGDTLRFYYGYNAGGFNVAAITVSARSLAPLELYAAPGPGLTPAAVTPVPAQAALTVVPPTATPTITQTPTHSPTGTISATITPTYTITQTYTETPVAAAPADGILCYPNPFDLRSFNKVTIRFQPVASCSVQVFNLLGEPIRTLDAADLYPANGWAIWHGEDDQLRKVGGGIYFVRVKVPDKVMVKRFTVLR